MIIKIIISRKHFFLSFRRKISEALNQIRPAEKFYNAMESSTIHRALPGMATVMAPVPLMEIECDVGLH